MNLHQISPDHKKIAKKRIGRGGKRGTYSGKGVKGQKSRAGSRIRPGTRDLIQQLPKLRGSRNMGARKRKPGSRETRKSVNRNVR
jgi:large subunit ribosomal protein L15